MNETNSDVIEDLLQNPERNFARLLFESPPLGVIEVLTELVLHPDNGHNATLQCLYVWQDLQNNEYTLSSILEEVQNAQEADIACACLTLVNRLIQHAPDSMKRIQIRRELEKIRFEEHLAAVSKCLAPSEQLQNATEKFSFLVHQPASTFISCVPVANFFAVTDADSGTFSSEEEDSTMNGTVDESALNGSNSQLNQNGELNSQFNNLISSFDSTDALELLAKLLKQLQETKQPPTKVLKQLNDNFLKLSEPSAAPKSNGVPPPPPPPNLSSKNAKVPAPPPIQPSTSQKSGPPAPPQLKSGPPLPPILGQAPTTSVNKATKVEVPQALKPKFTPPDGKKLRHLQWTKIPLNNLASTASDQGGSNVWLKMGNLNTDLLKNLDFGQLDSYFSCEPAVNDAQQNGTNEKEAKNLTVSLLCGKRSLSINVFLKSLKGMVDELITYIRSGQATEECGVERLKMLVPLLPTDEEIQTLKNYTGSQEVGTAESFLFKLLKVPDYKLRIESTILKEEFNVFISTIEPDLRTIITACEELRQSRSLQTILLILLHMGNYLNHGAAQGNAVGFKLASLWKIDELRAIKGGRTLLHLVSQQAEKANASLDEIEHVTDAAKLAFEALKSEVKTSVDRVNKLENQLKLKNDGFFEDIKTFLTDSKQRLERSNDLLARIETERQKLAVYFCENEKTFSLEECFKIMSNFRSRFNIAANENRQREEREKRMQEKNTTQAVPETPTICRPTVSEPIRSPITNRRSSVIVEQDRDRNSISPLLQSNRRKSSMRKDSAIFDRFNFDQNENDSQPTKSGDLGAFMDQALELDSRRRQSRFSPMNSPLPRVQEFRETTNTFNDNKEVDEVKVPVPTIDSQINKPAVEKVSNENVKPPEPARQKSIEKPTSKVNSASLVNSVTARKSPPSTIATSSKYSPTLSRTMRSTASGTTKTSPPSSNDPLYSKTTLRKVPLSPTQRVEPATPKEDPLSPAYRKQAMTRIRARQSNEPVQKPQTAAPVQPLRPSQVRMAQARLPNKSVLTTQSSTASSSSVTSRLSKAPVTSTASRVEPKTPVASNVARRSPTTPRATTTGRAPVSRPPTTPTSKEPTANRTPMSAAEKRSLFRQNTSLSTTSRPTLIRCGSKSEKPRWS